MACGAGQGGCAPASDRHVEGSAWQTHGDGGVNSRETFRARYSRGGARPRSARERDSDAPFPDDEVDGGVIADIRELDIRAFWKIRMSRDARPHLLDVASSE